MDDLYVTRIIIIIIIMYSGCKIHNNDNAQL